ncbi:MAG: hypothetical protein M0Z54_03720 [Thermaerobacter sp.]|nr:hypothetical protein [Thermaerobacter sp.]
MERDAWHDPEAVAEYVAAVRGSSPVNQYIEKPALRALMGPVGGLALVDLGAGAGDFACECAEVGARSVAAVEASSAMLALAREHPRVRYPHGGCRFPRRKRGRGVQQHGASVCRRPAAGC